MLREYAYLVRVEDPNSQAGNYGGGSTDGGVIKGGKGVQGRIAGGTVIASTEKEAKDKIQEQFSQKKITGANETGDLKVEIVNQKIHFLDISPRGVILDL